MKNKKTKGFSLMELMIAVAILGIISAIAVPSYVEYVKKGKRTDAKVELLRLAQLQESYFVQNLSYAQNFLASTAALGGLGLGTTATIDSEQGEYTISMTALGIGGAACSGLAAGACTSFTLSAAPSGSQTNDTECKSFTLTNTGLKGISGTPAPTGTVRNCWR